MGNAYFFTSDLCESTWPSCSSNDPTIHSYYLLRRPTLSTLNSVFSLLAERFTLIGSCNGLLCLYFDSSPKPFYGICNPVLGEGIKVPQLPTAPLFTYANHSGFGYCPKMQQYKVIRFMHLTSVDPLNSIESKRMVAYIHTLGSYSWRRIENAPNPKRNSFDPYLNGNLHWITNSGRPSELICSFDLEREKFNLVLPPAHFNVQYVNKVSCINIGVLRGCLCICYMYEDAMFEVWVMREYGAKESWTKEFNIDLKFYCRLRVQDLNRPIKFFGNGNLWFVSSSDCLVSFNPQKKTFRELGKTQVREPELSAHDLSFISIKDIAGGVKVENIRYERKILIVL